MLSAEALLVANDHLELVEVDCFREERVRDLDVLLLEVDADRQAVDDDKSGKCSSVSHDRTNVWQKDRKPERNQSHDKVQYDQLTPPYFFPVEKQVQQVSSDVKV